MAPRQRATDFSFTLFRLDLFAMRRVLLPLLALGCTARPCARNTTARRPIGRQLVVFITVDQMRADYARPVGVATDAAGSQRLATQGAFFTNAFQDHGVTETAPGHSVTMSGRFPRSTGILRNTAGVEDPQAPLVTSRDPGASPFRFRGSVLIDWIRIARPTGSRAVRVAKGSWGDPADGTREAECVLVRDVERRVHDEPLLRRYAARLGEARERAAGPAATGRARRGHLLRDARDYAEPDSVRRRIGGRDCHLSAP